MIWCYSKRTAVPAQQLTVLRNNIRFSKVVPENYDNIQSRPCLIILDDLHRRLFEGSVQSIYESQPSPKFQFHFDFPKPLSTGTVLLGYFTEREAFGILKQR